jgi:hypothetical protein
MSHKYESNENSKIICQIAEFTVGFADKPCQDLATVLLWLVEPRKYSVTSIYVMLSMFIWHLLHFLIK